MDGSVAQQVKQRGHVGLELLWLLRSAGGDAVPHCATAAEQEAERAPELEPGQTQSRRQQAFAPVGHALRPVADEQPTGGQARERASEMRAADRVEGGVYTGAAL